MVYFTIEISIHLENNIVLKRKNWKNKINHNRQSNKVEDHTSISGMTTSILVKMFIH